MSDLTDLTMAFVRTRINVIRNLFYQERKSDMLNFLEDTTNQDVSLPFDFNNEVKTRIMDGLDMVQLLYLLNAHSVIPGMLDDLQSVLTGHMETVRSLRFTKDMLSSEDDSKLGSMQMLPMDVRLAVWDMVLSSRKTL
jgi:hypothetical protein